ncbi:hypothetical protein JG688_00012497 [Phytophthora aleatoria]|uniref:Uncharacterized protein n=1 Tax=Phytophthora aleatoria TaxID=2496075 RepID=A0A8J5IPX5_9STRA|nr:hypothetical protein JG688_00012497 [Phytophthora aleatoria]
MAPKATMALEVFIERDQIPENLSILTYTEEEEVEDYFDADWAEQDADASPARSGSTSMEAICSSYAVTDSSSVLGVCAAPTTPAQKTAPRRMSTPLLMSIGETQASPKMTSMTPLYRPSELGIGISSIIGDQR